MSASAKFATGKWAYRVCDKCGVSFPYNQLRPTTIRGKPTGMLVCEDDFDPDHPQNFLPDVITVDAEALRNARPEDYTKSRVLPAIAAIASITARTFVGRVEVAP